MPRGKRKIMWQGYLDSHQYDFITKEAKRTGRTVASIVREALDRYIEDIEEKKKKALA